MRQLPVLGVVLLTTAVTLAGEEKAPVPPAVLDWTSSYWRYSLCLRAPEFSPPWKDAKGRTHQFLNYQRGWHIGSTKARVNSGQVPAGWTAPDFADSGWVHSRGGFREGQGWYDPTVRVALARGAFEVPDPVRVAKLELAVKYIGGLAVYVNGREVDRAHLPAGPLTGDTVAEPYPGEAYAWGIPNNKEKFTGYPQDISQWQAPNGKADRFRRLSVAIDPKLLVKGTNVLALGLCRAGYGEGAARWSYEAMNGYKNTPWPHLAVLELELRASPEGAIPRPTRPAGVQVWAEDVNRRVMNRDWSCPGAGAGPIRIVAARNGTFSGQAVVGTAAALTGLSARMSDLELAGGAGKIPASAVEVRYARGLPLAETVGHRAEYEKTYCHWLLESYGFANGFRFKDMAERMNPGKEIKAEAQAIAFFDCLSAEPPAQVPAGSCQPVWITVRVPKDATPGLYRGTLSVTAGGGHEVGVRLQVMDWALPNPRDFATFVGFQNSTESAAAQYKCALWSEEHWQQLERSARLLGEVGNDLAVLPLVCGGEAANKESIVAWVRKGDGYDYDWRNLDRYLEIVARHWGKDVAVIGELGWTDNGRNWAFTYSGVTLLDGGKRNELKLPAADSEEWAKLMVPYAKAVAAHVRGLGFRNLYWGWFYDSATTVQPLIEALAAECPDVGWARASHDGFGGRPFPKDSKATNLDMHIRGFPEPFTRDGRPASQGGWKKPGNVLFPRVASQIQAIGRFDSPMALRWLPENCIASGAAGFGRLGADFWPPFSFRNWYHPFQQYILAPGREGAESTVRFEALREGLQEAEVRIQLEKAGKDGAEPARSVLTARLMDLGALPTGTDNQPMCEYYGGWQERSWDLYAAAAAASGGRSPGTEDRATFFSTGSRK